MTIAVTNQKGGVAKTTSTQNIGACLARMGFKVLVIDFDPQGNLTKACGLDVDQDDIITLYSSMVQGEDPAVYSIGENIDLLAADRGLSRFEIDFQTKPGSEKLLARLLKKYDLETKYDFIFIDCQPAINLLTQNCYTASDFLLVPMEAHGFSVDGLEGVLDLMEELIESEIKTKIGIAGVFFTKHKANTIIGREHYENITKDYPDIPVFDNYIRDNVHLKDSTNVGLNVFDYVEQAEIFGSIGAQDYITISLELLEVLDMEPRKMFELPKKTPRTGKPQLVRKKASTPDAVKDSDKEEATTSKKVRKADIGDVQKGFSEFLDSEN